MSAMRLCLLAVIVAAGLVAAQTPMNGCAAATGTSALYINSTINCAQNTACTSAYTACLGTKYSCANATSCIAARFACMNAAAENTTGCPGLNDVQLALLAVAAGQLFNGSNAYKSCVATSCAWLNATYSGLGSNCTLSVAGLCKSPIVFIATLLFRGNFTAILADPVKRQAFADAIGRDASRILRIIGCFVRRMFLAGSRRQAADQTLVVELEVPGVSAKNADFKAQFDALAANPGAAFTEANAAYTAETGQTMTVLKIGTGSSSQAFSGGIPTAAPATTRAVTASATSGVTSNTTHGPTTTMGGGSGVAAQSLLAVVVAIVAAMLF